MKNRVFSFLPRFSILLLFLGMVIGEAYAQSQTITGVVKDQTGEPLIGVNVMEKGTTNGSITDVDGKYSLTVNGSKAIVTFSYIGYLSQDITVGNQKMIDVTMKEDTEELEEVVVIGYGKEKRLDRCYFDCESGKHGKGDSPFCTGPFACKCFRSFYRYFDRCCRYG